MLPAFDSPVLMTLNLASRSVADLEHVQRWHHVCGRCVYHSCMHITVVVAHMATGQCTHAYKVSTRREPMRGYIEQTTMLPWIM